MTIYVNGKFVAQRVTGVQRFATELTRALDGLLASEADAPRFVLLLPPGAAPLGLTTIVERIAAGPASLHLWEQAALPWGARNGLLLNLTGSAPLLHPRQIASLHDMAVFDHPEAYSWMFARWYRFLFTVLARRARAILTVSNFSKQAIERILAPRAPVTVVYNSFSHFDHLVPVRPDGLPSRIAQDRFILAVGSANPTKNFARLLQAVSLLPETGLELCIAGGGNGSVFRDRADGLATDRVTWTGAVTDANLKWLYGNARSFVFPSIYEGFGIPPLEAMTCGCPVVAADAASIPEVCGDAAVYFDPYDPHAIAAAITAVNVDDTLRARLVDAGSRQLAKFSWAKSARIVLDVTKTL